MQGINIIISQEEKGLVIDNLNQSYGIEFKVVEFEGKRKTLDNAQIKDVFTLSKPEFIKLANALKKHADILETEKATPIYADLKVEEPDFFKTKEKQETKKKREASKK